MNEQPRPWLGIRDALWLAVIVLALVAWAWDRNKLTNQVEQLGPVMPGAPDATPIPQTTPMQGGSI